MTLIHQFLNINTLLFKSLDTPVKKRFELLLRAGEKTLGNAANRCSPYCPTHKCIDQPGNLTCNQIILNQKCYILHLCKYNFHIYISFYICRHALHNGEYSVDNSKSPSHESTLMALQEPLTSTEMECNSCHDVTTVFITLGGSRCDVLKGWAISVQVRPFCSHGTWTL